MSKCAVAAVLSWRDVDRGNIIGPMTHEIGTPHMIKRIAIGEVSTRAIGTPEDVAGARG